MCALCHFVFLAINNTCTPLPSYPYPTCPSLYHQARELFVECALCNHNAGDQFANLQRGTLRWTVVELRV